MIVIGRVYPKNRLRCVERVVIIAVTAIGIDIPAFKSHCPLKAGVAMMKKAVSLILSSANVTKVLNVVASPTPIIGRFGDSMTVTSVSGPSFRRLREATNRLAVNQPALPPPTMVNRVIRSFVVNVTHQKNVNGKIKIFTSMSGVPTQTLTLQSGYIFLPTLCLLIAKFVEVLP